MRGRGRWDIAIRCALEGMNHIRELDGVSNEKDRQVVSYKIIVSILSVELNGKSTGIPHSISRATATGYSRKPYKYRGLFIGVLKELRLRISCHALVNLKVAMCPGALGVDNPFRDAFPIKMSYLLDKLDVL